METAKKVLDQKKESVSSQASAKQMKQEAAKVPPI